MRLFEQIKAKLGGGTKSMYESVIGLITDPSIGGMTGMVDKFKKQGLGDVISSWIGSGSNKAISPEQIQKVFGTDKIQQMASKMGISTEHLLHQMAHTLPQVVDKLTPDGKVPDASQLEAAVNAFKHKHMH